MTRLFQKRTEDFTCDHCGTFNSGNGYTNHCQNCLWSKHVDNNPGDRASLCQGLMEPLDVEQKDTEFIIVNKCVKCGHIRKNRTVPGDNYEVIVEISKMK